MSAPSAANPPRIDHVRGLDFRDVAEAIRPGVESLEQRLRTLAASLSPQDSIRPERRRRPRA